MKRSQISSLIALVAISTLAVGLAGGWVAASTFARAGNGPLFWAGTAFVLILIVSTLFAMHRFSRAFLLDVRRLSAAGRLVLDANVDYRIPPQGHPDIRELTAVLNEFADRFARLQHERETDIRQARADLEEERSLLAALMAELTEGVLVCNLDGQILLYNRGAHRLLDSSPNADVGAYVGLGRSVFGVLDRSTIIHAAEQVQARFRRRERSEQMVVVGFIATAANGRLLRVRLAPFTGGKEELRGYVITMQDISEGIERSNRRDALLRSLSERLRAGIGAIRAAIETVENFPEMAPVQRGRFQQVISDEAHALSDEIDHALLVYANDLRAQWRLEDIASGDMIAAVQKHLSDELQVTTDTHEIDDTLWIKIDSYSLVQGVSHLASNLKDAFGITTLTLALKPVEQYAALDIGWATNGVEPHIWQTWKEQALVTDARDGITTLSEVAERHGGEVWFQLSSDGVSAYFRLLLPRSPADARQPSAPSAAFPPPVESRPEYYDFDLFHQPGQRPELDDLLLRSITYTVFDTETTGLTPGLDEIISIGALRIVNSRLLRQETFEHLIDPGRSIPSIAIAIHGITDLMVKGQPTIESVLPRFHKFADTTVLVGHNLAFDMRMFQVKEAVTGVCFGNPILDTLLLSTVLHPDEDRHGLEDIAHRLGVQVLGRHTALGDAIVAGEVFLRMIPLLEQRGIRTLRQARDAAQQSYLARLEY